MTTRVPSTRRSVAYENWQVPWFGGKENQCRLDRATSHAALGERLFKVALFLLLPSGPTHIRTDSCP